MNIETYHIDGNAAFPVLEIINKEYQYNDKSMTEKFYDILYFIGYAFIHNMNGNKAKAKYNHQFYMQYNEKYKSGFNKKEIKDENTNDSNLQDIISELNSLVGLNMVKEEVNTIINLIKVKKIRESKGLQQSPLSLHLVFSGNPGTGKTTVARIIGKIYCALGVLSKGHLIEVDRSGLVAGYVGQTAIKTSEVIEKAMGGILFIDEAYSLTSKEGDSDYRKEAVDTLLKAMEDHRDDLIVIVAGYPDRMTNFLKSNPGLQSRFNTFIHFQDYSPNELYDIFIGLCNKYNYTISDNGKLYLHKYFDRLHLNKDDNFANAREVRNYFENSMKKQANRLALDNDITDEELLEISLDDLKEYRK